MARYPSEEKDRFIVRMPDGMRDHLKDIAAKNGRSLNAEIISRLAETIEQEALLSDPGLTAETIAPVLERMNTVVASRYEGRLEKMEHLLVLILEQIASGGFSASDKSELAQAVTSHKQKSKDREGSK